MYLIKLVESIMHRRQEGYQALLSRGHERLGVWGRHIVGPVSSAGAVVWLSYGKPILTKLVDGLGILNSMVKPA